MAADTIDHGISWLEFLQILELSSDGGVALFGRALGAAQCPMTDTKIFLMWLITPIWLPLENPI